MRFHEHAQFPTQPFSLKLKGEEVEFMLKSLQQIHATLINVLKDEAASQDERQRAYDFALGTEVLYGNIFKQLKLHRPERQDLN